MPRLRHQLAMKNLEIAPRKMVKNLYLAAAAVAFASTGALAGQLNLMTAHDKAQLEMSICMDHEYPSKVLVVDTTLLKSVKTLNCKTGPAAVRVTEDSQDPGHLIVNIDPPKGDPRGFDCDAKADINVEFIGLNCLEADYESSSHKKN